MENVFRIREKLSLEELKQRNKLQELQTQTPPILEQKILQQLELMNEELLYQSKVQYNILQIEQQLLDRLKEMPSYYAVHEQSKKIDVIIQELQSLNRTILQAGKQKERAFSLPKFRLPRIELGVGTLCLLWGVVALAIVCFALAHQWNLL